MIIERVKGEVDYSDILQKANRGEFTKWNHTAYEMVESGYEDVINDLTRYTAEDYNSLTDGEQEKYVDELMGIYKRKGIFPLNYYSEEGVINEISKCIGYNAEFDGDTVSCGAGIGTGLCNFMFPNLYDVVSAKDKDKVNAESGRKKFVNDKFLRKAIKFCFTYKGGKADPRGVFGGLRMVGSMPSNFRPMNAKAIYERFTNNGDIVYDFCCGFGGRMLGALSSNKELIYVGTDPNTETMYHLYELGEKIEQVTGRVNSFELHCCGSEELTEGKSIVDFAFSSPPYYDLEIYSDEETQSVNKFKTLDEWKEGYVRQTVKNIVRLLKPGKYYAVNIADFTDSKGENVNYVDDWIKISQEEGASLYSNLYLGVTARAGSKQQGSGELKKENILVFKKALFSF